MTATGPCVRKREAPDSILDNLEERIGRGYTTSGSSDTACDDTSYRESFVASSNDEDVDSGFPY